MGELIRRQITAEWSIEVEDDFASRLEDGDLQLVVPGRTIWLSVWAPEDEPIEVVAELREGSPDFAQRFEEYGPHGELRYATYYPEDDGSGGTQYSLHAYAIASGSFVQAAFLFDSPDDLDWALERWRSLRLTASYVWN